MVRAAAALLALAMLFTPVAAQQATTHTVVRGDTLWELAERYLGDGHEWSRIYEANREVLSSPDALEPGMELRIPGTGGEVERLRVIPSRRGENPPPEALREPPAREADEPAAAEPAQEQLGIGGRTVFYRETEPLGGIGPDPMNFLEITEDGFWSAHWLVEPGRVPEHTGVVIGFEGAEEIRAPRYSARPYDQMRVAFDGPVPSVGDPLQVFRPSGLSLEGVADVMRPTGTMTVTGVSGDTAIARVDQGYHRLQKGDYVRPLEPLPLTRGDHPTAVMDGPRATILGFAERHEIHLLGDQLFLDIGRDADVRVGDEFVVPWREGEESSEGVLKVIAVQDSWSTARIKTLKNPVFLRGVRVRLSRKMP